MEVVRHCLESNALLYLWTSVVIELIERAIKWEIKGQNNYQNLAGNILLLYF